MSYNDSRGKFVKIYAVIILAVIVLIGGGIIYGISKLF